MRNLRRAAAVAGAAAAFVAVSAVPASAATPIYRPITVKPWTYNANFNKAAKLDTSLIRLASPSKWKLTPKTAARLSATRIQELLAAGPDLRNYAEPVGNQGGVGSCTAWAVVYGMLGWWQNKKDWLSFAPSDWFNPMSIYRFIRGAEPPGGAWPADALNRVKDLGAVRAKDYPTDEFDYTYTPSALVIGKGAPFKFSSWRSLFANGNPYPGAGTAGANLIKNELANGRPVAVSARVYSDFTGMGAKPSSFVYAKSSSASYRGLHEMLAVGYNSFGLLLQNSWGAGFASSGFIRVSWAYVQSDIYEAEVADGVI